AMLCKSAKISVMGFLWVSVCPGRHQLYLKKPYSISLILAKVLIYITNKIQEKNGNQIQPPP
ncbi:MAG: hypothetical protein WCE68_00845, partial [Anaerolineales bacterium]